MAPFDPKEPIELAPPRTEQFTIESLFQCQGQESAPKNPSGLPCMYIGIKSTVFDVSHNTKAYGEGKGYHVFVGRDASRALGKSSLQPEDTDINVSWDYSTLNEKELKVLDDWYTFFSKRYNVMGKVDLPKKPAAKSWFPWS